MPLEIKAQAIALMVQGFTHAEGWSESCAVGSPVRKYPITRR